MLLVLSEQQGSNVSATPSKSISHSIELILSNSRGLMNRLLQTFDLNVGPRKEKKKVS
jgi:hypothetical protein